MPNQEYIQFNEAGIISNSPLASNNSPEPFLTRRTVQDKSITINCYYGSRPKFGRSIYYIMKYGKHYRFKIKNCKHNYKPRNISKQVENLIQRIGVFKLK